MGLSSKLGDSTKSRKIDETTTGLFVVPVRMNLNPLLWFWNGDKIWLYITPQKENRQEAVESLSWRYLKPILCVANRHGAYKHILNSHQASTYDDFLAKRIVNMTNEWRVSLNQSYLTSGTQSAWYVSDLWDCLWYKRSALGHADLVFPKFIKNRAGAVLSVRTWLGNSHWFFQEVKLTSYCPVVEYLPNSYSTDDLIAKANTDVINFKYVSNFNAFKYSQGPSPKALHYGSLYNGLQWRAFCLPVQPSVHWVLFSRYWSHVCWILSKQNFHWGTTGNCLKKQVELTWEQ